MPIGNDARMLFSKMNPKLTDMSKDDALLEQAGPTLFGKVKSERT